MNFDWFLREEKNKSVNLLCHEYLIICWEKKKKEEEVEVKKQILTSLNLKTEMSLHANRWGSMREFYCFIAITKIFLPSPSSTERILAKKKLSCGAREGQLGCHYWISVLTNWFSLEMLLEAQLTWSSVNVFLSFCWHNIEVLIGYWWLRMEVMRDSVKNSRLIFCMPCYCHRVDFYGKKCEIAIFLYGSSFEASQVLTSWMSMSWMHSLMSRLFLCLMLFFMHFWIKFDSFLSSSWASSERA